jgi:type IV pilus assembly protein PilQ
LASSRRRGLRHRPICDRLGAGASLLSPRGNVAVDDRTNTLLLQDTADRLADVRRLVATLDIPVRQVLIEARIVIANDVFSKQLGVRFGAQTGFTFNKYAVGQGGSLDTQPVVHLQGDKLVRDTRTQTPFELASGLASAGYSDQPQLNVNLPVVNPAGQLALTLINLGSGNLINLELSALEAELRRVGHCGGRELIIVAGDR